MRLRKSVLVFARRMEAKLQQHDDRPGWEEDALDELYERAKEEMEEVRVELQWFWSSPPNARIAKEQLQKVADECADVANFMMMMADNATHGRGC
jgi:hypothetical protein